MFNRFRSRTADAFTIIDALGSLKRPEAQGIIVEMILKSPQPDAMLIHRTLTSLVDIQQKPLPVSRPGESFCDLILVNFLFIKEPLLSNVFIVMHLLVVSVDIMGAFLCNDLLGIINPFPNDKF